MTQRRHVDEVPDARDGLTRTERIVLHVLNQAEQECGARPVPTVMLYGRVLEHIDLSEDELEICLRQLAVK